MSIVKRDHRVESIIPHYDASGDVVDVEIQVNYELYDDVAQEPITRHRSTRSLLNNLTPNERTNLGILFRRFKTLGESL